MNYTGLFNCNFIINVLKLKKGGESMLRLILGKSGSGKTFKIINEIVSRAQNNKIIVIVPEQYSFAAERTFQKKLKGMGKLNVEVLSFTRLCHTIFSMYGVTTEEKLEDSGRHILMSVALNKVKGDLELYSNYYDKIEFISSMVMTVTELENSGISPMQFDSAVSDCTNSFSKKLHDISKIYSAYIDCLNEVGLENNEYRKALELAQKHNFFADYDVYIDGFTAFMAGEKDFIGTMIKDAKSTTVCVLTDSIANINGSDDIFFSSKKTISKLKRMANELSKSVEVEILTGQKRWDAEELSFLAENFLQTENVSCENKPTSIEVYSAKDKEDEIEYIAAMIGNLTRNENYRYKDITVVTRSSNDYAETIRTIFERYNIPVFYDKRSEILKEPLVFAVFSFLFSIDEKNATDTIFSLLKSPFSPFDFSDVCQLENYCYIWGIELKDFNKKFENSLDGLAGTNDDDKLIRLNEIRESLVNIIKDFKEKTKKTNGKQFAKAIYDFLEEFQIKKRFEFLVNEEKIKGDLSEAVRMTAIWNTFVKSLEQMAISLPSNLFTLDEMIELFIVAISASDYGSVPPHLDEVTVTDANRVRYNEPKVVFVFGANDGEFPKTMGDNLLLNIYERAYLIGKNLDIGSETVDSFSDERMYAYNAISAPSKKLFVSYSKQSAVSDFTFPSAIVEEITRIFPSLVLKTRDDINIKFFLHTPESIRHYYALDFSRNNIVRRIFEKNELDKAFEERVKKTVYEKPSFAMNEKKVCERLFGRHMKLSATQVEGFYNCSFKYFCEKGLRARPRQKAEMAPMHSGTFIHHCLYHLIMENGKEKLVNLTLQEISEQVEKITDEYVKNELDLEKINDPRLEALVLRLRSSVVRLVLRIQEEFKNTQFLPIKFEAKIGSNETIHPIFITLSNGATLCVEGAIDRVDEYEEDGIKYIRVIDYKSGKKEFKLSDVSKGLNMQMLLYLFTLCDEENKVPAGILYMPSGDDYIKAKSSDEEEKILDERRKKQCMNGLIIDDPKIIRAMEKNTQGIYIPAKIIKDNEVSSKSIASREDFVQIRKIIEENLFQMGTALQEGNFSPMPTTAKDYDACKYCFYNAVCGMSQNKQETTEND